MWRGLAFLLSVAMGVITDVKQESSLRTDYRSLAERGVSWLAHARDYKASTKAGVIDLRDTKHNSSNQHLLSQHLRWSLSSAGI